jgi:hypothetical protein
MCETLEHLNFNPLPVLFEINRVLKINGIFYLSLPNLAKGRNRINMLLGRSINNPINDYFAQLGRKGNMIVGIHWREYTAKEVKEMLEKLGFEVHKHYLYSIDRYLFPINF